MITKIVNLRFRSYDVYIGRSSIFGNPFKNGSRDENCDEYRDYFYLRLQCNPVFKGRVLELQGEILGCFCKPKRCHGDTIVAYLEGQSE